MAKVYMVTDADVNRLKAYADRAPQYGSHGGSSACLSPEQARAYEDAHRFYNRQILTWLEEVTK